MSSQNVDRDKLESWTAPRSSHVAACPERDSWLAFGQLVDTSVPAGDNNRLIERINQEMRCENVALPWTKRFLRIAEPIAAFSTIAALVAIALVWNRPADDSSLTDKHEINSASVTPWNDDLATPMRAAETATVDLSVEFSRTAPIESDFAVVEQALSNLADDLDQSRL